MKIESLPMCEAWIKRYQTICQNHLRHLINEATKKSDELRAKGIFFPFEKNAGYREPAAFGYDCAKSLTQAVVCIAEKFELGDSEMLSLLSRADQELDWKKDHFNPPALGCIYRAHELLYDYHLDLEAARRVLNLNAASSPVPKPPGPTYG